MGWNDNNDIVGTIKLFAGNYVPEDYLECDGEEYDASENFLLAVILGTTPVDGNREYTKGVEKFRTPKLEAPEGLKYIILVNGRYPARR